MCIKRTYCVLEWGSRGREFKSLHPDQTERLDRMAKSLNIKSFLFSIRNTQTVLNRAHVRLMLASCGKCVVVSYLCPTTSEIQILVDGSGFRSEPFLFLPPLIHDCAQEGRSIALNPLKVCLFLAGNDGCNIIQHQPVPSSHLVSQKRSSPCHSDSRRKFG